MRFQNSAPFIDWSISRHVMAVESRHCDCAKYLDKGNLKLNVFNFTLDNLRKVAVFREQLCLIE